MDNYTIDNTTIQREWKDVELYTVSDLNFPLGGTIEGSKELQVWGKNTCIDLVAEPNKVNAVYSAVFNTNRLLAENMTVQEVVAKSLEKTYQYVLSLDETYAPAWETTRTHNEAINTAESYSKTWKANRIHNEKVNTIDNISNQWIADKLYPENVKTTEEVGREWIVDRLYLENSYFTETFNRQWEINRLFMEAIQAKENNLYNFSQFLETGLNTADTTKKDIKKPFEENGVVSETYNKTSEGNYFEDLDVAEQNVYKVSANYFETAKVGEVYSQEVEFISDYDEGLTLNTAEANNFTAYFSEGLYADSTYNGQINILLQEQAAIGENVSKTWRVMREVDETTDVSCDVATVVTSYKEESVSIKDKRIRPTTNGVLSNVIIAEGGVTYETFKKTADQIAGYAPFVEFKVGDYRYKEAVFRMVLSRQNINATPLFYDYSVHVDIPDTFDRGECAVDGETKVYFNKNYYHAPEVNVTTTGGTEVLIPRIMALDGQDGDGRYFTVILENASGESKAGRISWSARGY